jgi:glycosyltransferase involved in cell wall biosynthesis
MRVGVFLDDIRPQEGGGFTFIHDVAAAFLETADDSRHEFVLFCPPDYARRVERSSPPRNVRTVAMAPRGLLGRAVAGMRHYLPVSGFFLRRPGALERRARQEGVQVMWFVGGFHDTLDIPYVSTVWDLQHRTHPWFPEVSAGWKWDHRDLLISRHLRRAARVIAGTEVGRAEVESFYGVPRGNIRVLPHPTPGFALKAAMRPPADRPPIAGRYMLYPAQFWAHKNHASLLLAWRLLLDRGCPAPTLVLIGSDKGNRSFIEGRVRELGLTDHVRLMGFVPVADLVALYRNAEALIYASFSGPENLPPLEAFALGCPVIASEFPGAREQLGDAAVYFNPHDPVSIAEAVIGFSCDDSRRRDLVAKGRVRAERSTGPSFVRGVFQLLDEFEAERRCWA